MLFLYFLANDFGNGNFFLLHRGIVTYDLFVRKLKEEFRSPESQNISAFQGLSRFNQRKIFLGADQIGYAGHAAVDQMEIGVKIGRPTPVNIFILLGESVFSIEEKVVAFSADLF